MYLITLPLFGFLFAPFFIRRPGFKKALILSSLWQFFFYWSGFFFYGLYHLLPYFLEEPITILALLNTIFLAVSYLSINFLIYFDRLDDVFKNSNWLKKLDKNL